MCHQRRNEGCKFNFNKCLLQHSRLWIIICGTTVSIIDILWIVDHIYVVIIRYSYPQPRNIDTPKRMCLGKCDSFEKRGHVAIWQLINAGDFCPTSLKAHCVLEDLPATSPGSPWRTTGFVVWFFRWLNPNTSTLKNSHGTPKMDGLEEAIFPFTWFIFRFHVHFSGVQCICNNYSLCNHEFMV